MAFAQYLLLGYVDFGREIAWMRQHNKEDSKVFSFKYRLARFALILLILSVATLAHFSFSFVREETGFHYVITCMMVVVVFITLLMPCFDVLKMIRDVGALRQLEKIYGVSELHRTDNAFTLLARLRRENDQAAALVEREMDECDHIDSEANLRAAVESQLQLRRRLGQAIDVLEEFVPLQSSHA